MTILRRVRSRAGSLSGADAWRSSLATRHSGPDYSDQELRLPGSVNVTVVVPATVGPSGARAGVKRNARITSSNFRA